MNSHVRLDAVGLVNQFASIYKMFWELMPVYESHQMLCLVSADKNLTNSSKP